MLVLTRREGESLLILTPDNQMITVTLTKCRDVQMEVGVDAPQEFLIVRKEATNCETN